MSIISNAPYYDKYDRSKKYTQLLAVPGRVAQAREITEIQSTLKDIIKSLGDSLMDDGDVLEGCKVTPDKSRKIATIVPGKVYMKGMVLELYNAGNEYGNTVIDINAEGTEIIGVRLKESIVYESDDKDLRDPALGFENYNQPGCDRLKSELEIVVIREDELDSSIAKLATIIDGELYEEQEGPTYSALEDTLARRTYDESGSYIVEGMHVRVEANSSDENTFNVVVEPGKAYVQGYEVNIHAARRLSLPRSTTYSDGYITTNYTKGINYQLSVGPYIKEITKVRGSLLATESVTIKDDEGAALMHNSAQTIIKVQKDSVDITDKCYLMPGVSGGVARIYVRKGEEYPGDDVVVTYHYDHDFNSSDYTLILEDNDHYMKWVNPNNQPLEGTSMAIHYDKYLARKDNVYIDQYGNIDAVIGIPADYGLEVIPNPPAYTLSLASIMSPPGGSISSNMNLNINVSNIGLTRFTMNDIHRMLKRIRTIEYDQTVISLNNEAKEYSSTDKRGIYTDPFIDLSKIAFQFNLLNGKAIRDDVPIFDATIDLDSNMVYLPLINSFQDAVYNTSRGNVNKYDRTVTLRKDGERVALSQMKATKSFLVSPYLAAPQTPEVFITPAVDMWYDDTLITVPKSINNQDIIVEPARHVYTSSGSGNASSTTVSSSTTTSAIGKTVQKVVEENVISESAVTYIRPREISVSGNNYPPSLDNIKCYFEGVEAKLTPTGDTVKGTLEGSVKSDSKGHFTAKFTIPDKILTGSRVVKLESNIQIEGYNTSAFAFYQATGIARTIQKTVTTITTVLLNRVTTVTHHTNYWQVPVDPDPLAQTFILDKMTLLSGIDIYFENVPESNIPVTCEIREVVNGNITSRIYGFNTLTANEIRANISSDSSKPTRFKFHDPVLIEPNKEYAFVLRSSSQDYRVFVAEIGEEDLISHEPVLSNPYLLGVMMSSSNNRSWTNHQKSDVKFRLISDVYSRESEVYFDNIHVSSGFCRMILSAESIVFDGTKINWEYSLDNGNSWIQITPYDMKVVSGSTDVLLRAILSREARTELSPIVALDTVNISAACYDNSVDSYYISNLISGLDKYNTVELILDTSEAESTSIEVYVSPSANNADNYILKKAELLNDGSIKPKEIAYGWFEKTYKVTLDAPATQCRIFVKLNSNSKYYTPAFRRLRAIMT